MGPLGHTRSSVTETEALITPDTQVWMPLTGWRGATAAMHISPAMGARFSQATVAMEAGGVSGGALAGVERVVYVLEGSLALRLPGRTAHTLTTGMFAFLPADRP